MGPIKYINRNPDNILFYNVSESITPAAISVIYRGHAVILERHFSKKAPVWNHTVTEQNVFITETFSAQKAESKWKCVVKALNVGVSPVYIIPVCHSGNSDIGSLSSLS